MVVDKYVGRCLDVGSTPTGSIIPWHSFAFLGKTLLNQRFLFLSLVFLGILLQKRIQQRIQHFCRILEIYVLRKAFSDVVLCLLRYVGINVHGRFQV